MWECNEIHIDGEQHQLNRHEDNDQIFPVKKNSDDAYRKQNRTENQEMGQSEQDASLKFHA